MMTRAAIHLISALFLLPAATGAQAATYTLHADGSGDFATIQDALDAAVGGDIILLTDGTFTGAGNRDIDFLGKALTVRSQSGNAAACIIACMGSASEKCCGFLFETGETAAAILQEVTVQGGYAVYGGALHIDGSSPTVTGCILEDNIADLGGAIYCGDGAGAAFSDCIIRDNAAGSGGAMYIHQAAPGFTDCQIIGNAAPSGGGVFCYGAGATPSFTTCTLAGNAATISGGGLECYDAAPTLSNTIIAFTTAGGANSGAGSTLSCCNIFGNVGGDWVGGIADQLPLNGNISCDPQFCDPVNADFTLCATSPCVANSEPNPACTRIGAAAAGCGVAPIARACCAGDSCFLISEVECAYVGGTWQSGSTSCDPNPCPTPEAACCQSDGGCQISTQSACDALGGDWEAAESSCSPNPCPQSRGGLLRRRRLHDHHPGRLLQRRR